MDDKYLKSFIGVKENNKYKLIINQTCEQEEDYVKWGEWRSHSEKFDNSITKYFNSKEELYDAILQNLNKYKNINFDFKTQNLFLCNEDKNILELNLKKGTVYVDNNNYSSYGKNPYVEEKDVENFENKEIENNSRKYSRRHIRSTYLQSSISQTKNIKVIEHAESVTSIKLRLRSVKEFLMSDEKKDIIDFKNYLSDFILKHKGINVDINIPIYEYNDTKLNKNTYCLVHSMMEDSLSGKNIFCNNKYNEIFYLLGCKNMKYFEKPKDIKPIINQYSTVIFKYKKTCNRSVEINSEEFYKKDYENENKFFTTVKNRMYDLMKYFKKSDDCITVEELKIANILIICFYKITESDINLLKEYLNIYLSSEDIDCGQTFKESKNSKSKIEKKVEELNITIKKSDFTIKKDENGIYYFMTYEPFWVYSRRGKSQNPNFSEKDSKILDLKNENNIKLVGKRKSRSSYKNNTILPSNYFFDKIFASLIMTLLDLKIQDISVTIVPSHSIDKISIGMERIVNRICSSMDFENKVGMLKRYKQIEKLSNGGNRDKRIHYNSIKVFDKASNNTILLLDDVTTTGNSLLACKDLLEKEGYTVICVAIAKTRSLH